MPDFKSSDKYTRYLLKDKEQTPPSSVWEGLSSQIGGSRNKSGGLLHGSGWIIAVIGMILTSTALASWIYFNPDEIIKDKVEITYIQTEVKNDQINNNNLNTTASETNESNSDVVNEANLYNGDSKPASGRSDKKAGYSVVTEDESISRSQDQRHVELVKEKVERPAIVSTSKLPVIFLMSLPDHDLALNPLPLEEEYPDPTNTIKNIRGFYTGPVLTLQHHYIINQNTYGQFNGNNLHIKPSFSLGYGWRLGYQGWKLGIDAGIMYSREGQGYEGKTSGQGIIKRKITLDYLRIPLRLKYRMPLLNTSSYGSALNYIGGFSWGALKKAEETINGETKSVKDHFRPFDLGLLAGIELEHSFAKNWMINIGAFSRFGPNDINSEMWYYNGDHRKSHNFSLMFQGGVNYRLINK